MPRTRPTADKRPVPRKLGVAFFRVPAVDLARALIGTILVRRLGDTTRRARIVETEAYIGEHDLACHAAKGRTLRTDVMFGPGGHAYVYLIYGMYQMLNVVASAEGDAQAVLIRAAEPLDGWNVDLSGPGKLARGFHITRRDNAADLTGDTLYFEPRAGRASRIQITKRIGVDFADEWKDALLRFIDAGSSAVSGKRARRR